MVEVRLHNPKLRLAVNIILTVLFAAFFIYCAILIASESSTLKKLRARVDILQEDVLKKQEALFAEQRKFEQARSQMSPRQMVDASFELERQRDSLAGSQDQLADLETQRGETAHWRLFHIYWLIFTLIAFPVVFWINYALNY